MGGVAWDSIIFLKKRKSKLHCCIIQTAAAYLSKLPIINKVFLHARCLNPKTF